MERWHLTLGLTALALTGAIIAPRLLGLHATPPTPPQPPVSVVLDPLPDPIVEPQLPAVNLGHLEATARLDRSAVQTGVSEERFLAITIKAPEELGQTFHRPVDLAVVMDTSGSMSKRGKIDYAKRAAKLLASSMEPDDVYALVTFNDDATVVIPGGEVRDPYALHGAIDRIVEGGGTNLHAGLDEGADEVIDHLDDHRVGRLVVLSDGNANVGIKDPDALARYVSTLASKGVSVSTIGLGLDYNEDLLSRLADLGGGSYDFVDDPRELEAVFADELERSASVVARGTRVQIDLPPGIEPLEVIGWDATRDGNGWSLYVGDVYGGEARKIVARVRVSPDFVASVPAASVDVAYLDLVDGTDAHSLASAEVRRVATVAEAEASTDPVVAVEAVRAWGNDFLVQAAEAYQQGDQGKAAELTERFEDVVGTASTTWDNEALKGDLAYGRDQKELYQAYAPSSAEGQRAVKQTKENFIDQSRSLAE